MRAHQEYDDERDVVRVGEEAGAIGHELSDPSRVVPGVSAEDHVRGSSVLVRQARNPTSGLVPALHEGVAEEEDRRTLVRAAIARVVRVVGHERARALGDAAVDLGGVLALARPPQIVRGRRARPEPEQADEQQEGREATRAPAPRAGRAGRSASCAKHRRARGSGAGRRGAVARCWFECAPGRSRDDVGFSPGRNGSGWAFFSFPPGRDLRISPPVTGRLRVPRGKNPGIRRWKNRPRRPVASVSVDRRKRALIGGARSVRV